MTRNWYLQKPTIHKYRTNTRNPKYVQLSRATKIALPPPHRFDSRLVARCALSSSPPYTMSMVSAIEWPTRGVTPRKKAGTPPVSNTLLAAPMIDRDLAAPPVSTSCRWSSMRMTSIGWFQHASVPPTAAAPSLSYGVSFRVASSPLRSCSVPLDIPNLLP